MELDGSEVTCLESLARKLKRVGTRPQFGNLGLRNPLAGSSRGGGISPTQAARTMGCTDPVPSYRREDPLVEEGGGGS